MERAEFIETIELAVTDYTKLTGISREVVFLVMNPIQNRFEPKWANELGLSVLTDPECPEDAVFVTSAESFTNEAMERFDS